MLVLLGLVVAALLWGYGTAVSDPVVRRAAVGVAGWPTDARPLKAVLISDIHVIAPDMTPQRLSGIVAQINALSPDLVLIAGDFISDRRLSTRSYSLAEAIAPLAALRPRLATVAVLGNHEHWRNADEAREALAAAKIILLDNEAIQIGPLAIGGMDDHMTGYADPEATIAAMRMLPGARLLLSHSPDPFPALPRDIGLTLAGHTHCGQISLPWIGPLATFSDHGDRYACGIIREGGKTLIVSAGLGTSMLPLRLGTWPEIFLLELGPVRSAGAR